MSGPAFVVEERGFETPCWIWQGPWHSLGYGYVYLPRTQRCELAHRVIYEERVGPIAPSQVLHHRCEVPACVNPRHVEPMTQSEHMRLHHPRNVITHCVHGHPYDEANTYYWPNGSRRCKTCHREAAARSRVARRERAAA